MASRTQSGQTHKPVAANVDPRDASEDSSLTFEDSAVESGDSSVETEDSSEDFDANEPQPVDTSLPRDAQKVLLGYRKLSSRRIDLVGDYAGNELFLIDGDSMLLRAFSDEKLDFEDGCQVLHAAYNVEHFLHNLVQRKCRFNITFFKSNRLLCIPPNAAHPSRYLLARAAIIRHLQTNLTSQSPINVHVFDSWQAKDFLEYLQSTAPYFIMAHDGAKAVDRQAKFITEDATKQELSRNRVHLRQMILFFASRGFNVALLNGLEWRDTKVMTMVLETRIRGTKLPKWQPELSETPVADTSADVLKLGDLAMQLTERELLTVLALAQILRESITAELQRLSFAFLRHQALLAQLPLSQRRLPTIRADAPTEGFLSAFATTAEAVLAHPSWQTSASQLSSCDTHDALDGRLFFHVASAHVEPSGEEGKRLQRLVGAVKTLVEEEFSSETGTSTTTSQSNGLSQDSALANPQPPKKTAVLPFSNRVFDKHLESVRIKVDVTEEERQSLAAYNVFQEVSHWHNSKRPLVKRGPPTAAEKRMVEKAAKRNQLFMAEMRTYAASLTNAVGKSLEPETIIVGQTGVNRLPPSQGKKDQPEPDSDAAPSSNKKAPPKKAGGGGKTATKNAAKQAMMDKLAADKAKKTASAQDAILGSWQTACKGFEADEDPQTRYRKAKNYLVSLQKAWEEVIAPECELYMLACLVKYWIGVSRGKDRSRALPVTALIWSHARDISERKNVPDSIRACVKLTVETLGLPPVVFKHPEAEAPRKLAFTFPLPSKIDNLSTGLSLRDFQLIEAGPYLERSFDSQPDSRVDFRPDGWQRRVLDSIDADESVFVVAPTSAGKTFISFYAMRKVLEADDDGVLVYVAPTKALVNQLAAEIQARYSKTFKFGGKSVWAIHTRDYRINNPTGCQVLVTVPHVLQIMLLAGSHAKSWSSRVKRIIFDEIHSIGQAEDGVVWEQLLLMAPCPIIALSATVGNPEEFSSWLSSTQEAIGNKLVTVQHPYRYSDLRKYYYVPPRRFAFNGVPKQQAFGVLGLEGLSGFNHVHPVAALVDKSRGIPQDLGLEPRDCLVLWQAMAKAQTPSHPVSESLAPQHALPDVCRKTDVLKWEADLKKLLQAWLEDQGSPYDAVVEMLEQGFRDDKREPLYDTTPKSDDRSVAASVGDSADLAKTTLPLLCRLQEQDALPVIMFNYDRHQCENVSQALLEQLVAAETEQHKTGSKWEKQLERWEEWKALKEKSSSKTAKVSSKKSKKGTDEGEERSSKLDMQKDSAGADDSKWATFDPEAPAEGYHFADYTKVQMSEFETYVRQLRRRDVQPWLIEALARGVGIHHAGMNRKYRQVVEILFRKSFLRVVVATGTLALGINMPCKTVVFAGDSVFLTALNYRQCAGRAGRRGFDLLGNIVFQGVSRQKVCRLISSRLPDLNGHFPITTTLVLRLFTLLNDSNNAPYAVNSIDALLSQPRLYMGGPSFKDQTMHHLRFSIEYLRRQQLLGMNGVPLNFAGLVSHLYFTENSSFAFHTLLKEGYFHELCANVRKDEKSTLETLMLVLAHLFQRHVLRQADAEFRENVVKPSSSIVFLPPLPSTASQILLDHNRETLDIYQAYVSTFIDQHITEEDNALPLTKLQAGGDSHDSNTQQGTTASPTTISALPPTRIRSPFVALSAAGDAFDSIHDLCASVRHGVFLEEAVIPAMAVFPQEVSAPLNAWLLDFYKHGDVATLERANGVRRSDVWFLLNDFSLVLATIITSLRNFLVPGGGGVSDVDFLDVMGDFDAHEEAAEVETAASEEMGAASGAATPSVADSGVVLAERARPGAGKGKKKAAAVDSWEELEDDEAAGEELEELREAEALRGGAWKASASAWEGKGGEGLKDVLRAFELLHAEFTVKFKAMWA